MRSSEKVSISGYQLSSKEGARPKSNSFCVLSNGAKLYSTKTLKTCETRSVRLFQDRNRTHSVVVKSFAADSDEASYALQERDCFIKVYGKQFVEYFKSDGQIRIMMPYFEGVLFHYFVHTLTSEREVSQLALKVAKILQHLHDNKIAHLDIKEDNIIVKREGGEFKVRIIDFGWGLLFGAKVHCLPNEFCEHWAPELLLPNKGKVTVTSKLDVYSIAEMFDRLLLQKLYYYCPKVIADFIVLGKSRNPEARPELSTLIHDLERDLYLPLKQVSLQPPSATCRENEDLLIETMEVQRALNQYYTVGRGFFRRWVPFVPASTKTVRELQGLCDAKRKISKSDIETVFRDRDERKSYARRSTAVSYMQFFMSGRQNSSEANLSATDKVVEKLSRVYSAAQRR